MHVVIGFLGSVITILWLLHRLAEMGIDLGGLNPWLWRRRRKWRKTYEANPIYAIRSPLETTALLVAATAKADGDMTSDEKKAILNMFEQRFHLPKREAAGLLISSTHLLGNGEELRTNLKKVLEPSLDDFTESQASSALEMLREIANIGEGASETQNELVTRIAALFRAKTAPEQEWS